MPRIIDADALDFKKLKHEPYPDLTAKEIVEDAPTLTLDDIVPHGRWVYNTDDFTPHKRCTHCGYNKPIAAGEKIEQEPSHYCNNCGAKMQEEV